MKEKDTEQFVMNKKQVKKIIVQGLSEPIRRWETRWILLQGFQRNTAQAEIRCVLILLQGGGHLFIPAALLG